MDYQDETKSHRLILIVTKVALISAEWLQTQQLASDASDLVIGSSNITIFIINKINSQVTDAWVQVGGGPVLVPLAADRGLAVQRSVGCSELGVGAAGVAKDFSYLLHL